MKITWNLEIVNNLIWIVTLLWSSGLVWNSFEVKEEESESENTRRKAEEGMNSLIIMTVEYQLIGCHFFC